MGLLALAPTAAAQEDGVKIDPTSPAGKEYDIPLESARRGADPARSGGDSVVQGSRSAVPFGAGIESEEPTAAPPPAAAPSASASPERKERRRDARRSRNTFVAPSDRGSLPPEVISAAARAPAPSDGLGSLLLYAAGGLLVVAAGAVGGVLYRRRSTSG